MLANINDVFNFMNFLANKSQSGEITPEDFNISINVGQQQYFRTKLGLPELYTVGKREAPQQFQTTQNNSDSLRPFIVSTTLIKNGNGFDLPANFAAYAENGYLYVEQINGQTVYTRQPLDFVTLTERGERLQSYIDNPNFEYPIATYLNNQIVVDPDGINAIGLNYVRYPSTPRRNYTVVNDFNIYDPVGSVQLEFPNLDWENIAHIALKYWSQNLREEFLYQTEESRIKTGG